MDPIVIALTAAVLRIAWRVTRRAGFRRREAFIAGYPFPDAIGHKVKKTYPHLTDAQIGLVLQGLREFFHVCHRAGRRPVSMPSQVVDVAWHEFIVFTRAYRQFCARGLGRFLHHTPAEAMKTPTQAQQGIRRAWRIACAREGINPKAAARLPLLFALDALLAIPDGFKYSLNCRAPGGDGYCASHIGCSSGCAGDGGGDGGDGGGGCGGD